jgi:ubiquinone/menaquinone biosynthesis C-methylase UbiE
MKNFDENFGSQKLFYKSYYKEVMFGRRLSTIGIINAHKQMEKQFRGSFFSQVLEIGGGNGEHLDFIQHGFDVYYVTDINQPLLENKDSKNVIAMIANAEDLPFEENSFDRVVVTCLLSHVSDPETLLNEILRVMKPDGVATIFLSCDPGIMVRMVRSLTTARVAKAKGYNGYSLMIAREHRNHVGSLLQMTRYTFRNLKVNYRYYPFRVPSWNLNGYVIIQVST